MTDAITPNTPRWFYESYDGMDQDIEESIITAVTPKIIAEMGGKPIVSSDVAGKARLVAKAYAKAVGHADDLEGAVERAKYRMIWKMFHESLYRMLDGEYENIQEFLVEKIPRLSENNGALSDIMFMLEKVLPMLSEIGGDFSPERLMAFKENWSKTRASVNTMRKIFREFDIADDLAKKKIADAERSLKVAQKKLEAAEPMTPEYQKAYEEFSEISDTLPKLREDQQKEAEAAEKNFQNSMGRVLDTIADPSVQTYGPHGVKNAYEGIATTPNKVFDALVANGPNDMVYFVIKVPSIYTMLIEKALQRIVTFHLYDPKVLFEEMRIAFFPNSIPMELPSDVIELAK